MPEGQENAAEAPSEERRRRWSRWITWPIAILILLEVVYLIVGNTFLRTEWGHRVANRRAEKFHADWDSGWTWFPGLVSLSELEIGGRARRAEWRAEFEEARVWVWVPSLVGRHLRILRTRGEGASIDVQTLRSPGPRPEGKRRRGWRFTLGRLALDPVAEVQVNEYALEGLGSIRGWASFQARGPMAFDFGRFAFSDARLITRNAPSRTEKNDDLQEKGATSLEADQNVPSPLEENDALQESAVQEKGATSGEEVVAAEAMSLEAAVEIDPVTMGDTSVEEILASMTGTIRIDSESAGIGFLERYLGNFSWIDLGGRGRLHVDLEMTDGWLAPGSVVELDGPVVTAEFVGLKAQGEGRVSGGIPEGESHAEVRVDLARFDVSQTGAAALMAAGSDFSMTLRNDSSAIDRPAEGLSVEVVLPEAEVPELEAFNPFLPPSLGLELTGGEARLTGEMRFDSTTREGSGILSLDGRRVEARFKDLDLAAEIDLDAKFESLDLNGGVAEISGSSLDIERAAVQDRSGAVDDGWWGRLRLPAGTVTRDVTARAASPSRIEGLVEAELRDTGPFVALLEERMPKLSWIDGLLTVENVDADSQIRLEGPSLALRQLEMIGGAKGRLEILGELDFDERVPDGVLFARWGKLSAALALEEGKRDWKLTRSRRWYEEQADAFRRSSAIGEPGGGAAGGDAGNSESEDHESLAQ